MKERYRLLKSMLYPALFVAALWAVKGFEIFADEDLSKFGNAPRTALGMLGIFTSPLLHGDEWHLWANTMPLLVLGTLIIYFYPLAARSVIIGIYLISGIAVWLLARSVIHIGASGLVYGFAFFLFFSGVFRNDMKSLGISFFIIFMYGGIVWGLLPNLIGISWESHLFGAIAGSLLAYVFRTVDLPPKPQWYMEEDAQPEVNYRYIYVPKDKPAEPVPPLEQNNPAADEKGTDQNP